MARVDMSARESKEGITFCLFMGNPIKKYQPLDEGHEKTTPSTSGYVRRNSGNEAHSALPPVASVHPETVSLTSSGVTKQEFSPVVVTRYGSG
jgi:hypothetical protein